MWSKYDTLLACIGFAILLTIIGTFIHMSVVIGAALVGMMFMGVALFVHAPTDPVPSQPKDLSRGSP